MRPALQLKPCILAILLLAQGAAHASGVQTLKEVTIKGGRLFGLADTATEGRVSAEQIATRPLLRAAELIETIPGMIVTQHSGDGKANQYFLRGFNLDHGSDFATSVAGMPVNMLSHAHGQGYMDLNIVIPELVDTVRYRKGVYAAEDGDLSTTGSARIDFKRELEALEARYADLTVGPHDFRRLLAAGGTRSGEHRLLAALEVASNDGPWDQPEDLRKANGLLRWSSGTAANGHAVTVMAYRSRWHATEHVPRRAIDSGEIGRYGALAPSDGGITSRYSVTGEWNVADAAGSRHASAYLSSYRLNLFSAPSGFINGEPGDQHEQADKRVLWGGHARQTWVAGQHEVALGAQLRVDDIDTLGLYQTVARQRVETTREDRARETGAALYATVHSEWSDYLRSTVGLRHDRIRARVAATGGALNVDNGGRVSDGQTSPKLALVISPFGAAGRTEVFLNWGYGFHSNDVRGATSVVNPADGSPAERLDLFARSVGAEAGLRFQPVAAWNWVSSVSLWRMKLASELVFVGDSGVTEARGASHRQGLEWSNYLTPAPGVIVDADLAVTRARFNEPVDGGTHVPNAVPVTASVGVSYDRGGSWSGGLRARYIGAYALEPSDSQRSSALPTANLRLGYRFTPRVQLSVDVLNLFDRAGNDIEYWGGACTRAEQRAGECGEGIDGRLVHPLEPRTVRVSLRARF